MEFFQVKRLTPNAILPVRGSDHAAGYDICSSVNCIVPSWNKALISTGLAISIPDGYYARVASRSGLSVKNDIEVGAGVIDSDYRGELKVVLRNLSGIGFLAKAGDRIAQLIIEKIITPPVTEVDELTNTMRGAGGFGSTGFGSSTLTFKIPKHGINDIIDTIAEDIKTISAIDTTLVDMSNTLNMGWISHSKTIMNESNINNHNCTEFGRKPYTIGEAFPPSTVCLHCGKEATISSLSNPVQ